MFPVPTFLYTAIKDLTLYLKNRNKVEEDSPIVWTGLDIKPLLNAGKLSGTCEDYTFSAPDKIYKRTEGENPTHEIAWVAEGKKKRKVVCLRYNGEIDLILLKKR